MKKLLIIIAAVAMSMMAFAGSTATADDGADYSITCGPTPFPDPAAADDCMPESSPAGWNGVPGGQPAMDCEVNVTDPEKAYNQPVVFNENMVDCPSPAINLSISGKVFWTLCKQHDGTTCALNANALPHNPDSHRCDLCKSRQATPTMNGRVGYTRYYWAHAIARRKGVEPFSHWVGPVSIYIP